MLMFTLMTLVLSLIIVTTTSISYPPFYLAYAKMALPLTHSNVNGPSNKLTGLVIGLHMRFNPCKKKISAILHMYFPCNTTELCMFIGCVNYYRDIWPSRAHILKPLTDQSGLKTKALIFIGQIKCKRCSTKSTCWWLPMLLQLTRTTISGSIYTLMPLTST